MVYHHKVYHYFNHYARPPSVAYLPLQHVGPSSQISCWKLCRLLSATKTFCDFLLHSDYRHWQQRQCTNTSFHRDSWTVGWWSGV